MSIILASMLVCFSAQALELGEKRDPVAGEKEPDSAIDRFFVFKDKLTQAICNENFISRVPTLESISSATCEDELYLKTASVTRDYLLRFFLGDTKAGLWSDGFINTLIRMQALETSDLIKIRQAKRTFSMELCNSLLSPSKLASYIITERKSFLHLFTKNAGARKNPVNFKKYEKVIYDSRKKHGDIISAILKIKDTEGRMAKISSLFPEADFPRNSWSAAGWIEPYEVREISMKSRSLVRLVNPVTNQTTMLSIHSPSGEPLGFVYITPTVPVLDFDTLVLTSRTKEIRKKQISAYSSIIKQRLFSALKNKPKKLKELKKIQTEFNEMMRKYSAEQFKPVEGGIGELKKVFDEGFLRTLKGIRIGTGYVQLSIFYPDKDLEKMRKDFFRKLSRI